MNRQNSTKKIISIGMMMFMQYLMFAVWWIPLAAYLANLNMTGMQKSFILSSMALGAMASPIIGMLGDRYFNSERVLAVSNLLTAIFLFLAAKTTNPELLMGTIILGMLCYMPSWSLTSSIAMAHTSAEQFPRIRVFGSIGWVASGLFSLIAIGVFNVKLFDGGVLPLYCGAATSLIASFTNLFLPKTPPLAKGQKATIIDILGLRAFSMLRDRNFLVFMILSFLSIIPFSLYQVYGSEFLQSQDFKFITFTMNLGQIIEIAFMIIVTTVIIKLGIKRALVVGLAALMIRYILFYFGIVTGANSLHVFGILVHGVIFGLFYVGGQVYTDQKAPKELKAQAQGLLAFVVWGVGFFVGTFVNGWLIQANSVISGKSMTYHWAPIFLITAIVSLVIPLFFIIYFKEGRTYEKEKIIE